MTKSPRSYTSYEAISIQSSLLFYFSDLSRLTAFRCYNRIALGATCQNESLNLHRDDSPFHEQFNDVTFTHSFNHYHHQPFPSSVWSLPISTMQSNDQEHRSVVLSQPNSSNLDQFNKVMLSSATVSSNRLIEAKRKLSQLYPRESLQQAQCLSHSYRDQMSSIESIPLMYGETSIEGMEWILEQCTLAPNSSFADLGCGSGKSLAAMALLTSNLIKLTGIELVPELAQLAEKHCLSLRQVDVEADIIIKAADFLVDISWVNSDLIFSCATAFTPSMMKDIARVCERARVGAFVAVLSQPLKFCGDMFVLIASTDQLPVTWGVAKCFIYQKKHNRRLESVILRSLTR